LNVRAINLQVVTTISDMGGSKWYLANSYYELTDQVWLIYFGGMFTRNVQMV